MTNPNDLDNHDHPKNLHELNQLRVDNLAEKKKRELQIYGIKPLIIDKTIETSTSHILVDITGNNITFLDKNKSFTTKEPQSAGIYNMAGNPTALEHLLNADSFTPARLRAASSENPFKASEISSISRIQSIALIQKKIDEQKVAYEPATTQTNLGSNLQTFLQINDANFMDLEDTEDLLLDNNLNFDLLAHN